MTSLVKIYTNPATFLARVRSYLENAKRSTICPWVSLVVSQKETRTRPCLLWPPSAILLTEWCSAFTIEVGDTAQVERDERCRHVQDHIRCGTLFIWQDAGRPVSMAARTRPTAHGEVINDVYTPTALRGRDYATACVAALSQLLLDEGKNFCALFTDLANPTSNSIYQKIGYSALGDFVHYSFCRGRQYKDDLI